jgi:hypothetical protein
MTAAEADEILRKHEVPYYDYSISGPRPAEGLVLERRESGWVIYIWEKGMEQGLTEYQNEDTAAREFVRRVLKVNAMYALSKI